MSSYYSSAYGSNVVISQAGGRRSAYTTSSSSSRVATYSSPPPSSSYSGSMESSISSQSSAEARFRSGSSTGYYIDVKEVPNPRGGPSVVVVHHNQPNPDKDEPKSCDYYHTRGTSSGK
ncbi:hypothetical protein VTI74DRAFT_511 [Chaetomium olivicolor]